MPESNGAPIESYVVTCSKGTEQILLVNVTSGVLNYSITGLDWATEYTVRVMATNAAGTNADYNSDAVSARVRRRLL